MKSEKTSALLQIFLGPKGRRHSERTCSSVPTEKGSLLLLNGHRLGKKGRVVGRKFCLRKIYIAGQVLTPDGVTLNGVIDCFDSALVAQELSFERGTVRRPRLICVRVGDVTNATVAFVAFVAMKTGSR
jgi:hypothetical protein